MGSSCLSCRHVAVHCRWAIDDLSLPDSLQIQSRRHSRSSSSDVLQRIHTSNIQTSADLPTAARLRHQKIYRATLMHSADYAVARCLSVRHMPVFCLNGYTYPKLFSPWSSAIILVLTYHAECQHSNGNPPNGGIECIGVWKITIFDQYHA